MTPDGWVVIVPMLPSGDRVYAFSSREHAAEIFTALGGGGHGVTMKPFTSIPDER